jgi:tetratricopeptide (TPR) repeat protein
VRRDVVATGLVAVVGLGACGGTLPPPGPVTGPTGYEYPLGTPPSETRYSQTATLFFLEQNYARALELAREGISEEPENPIHYLLAGMTYLSLDDFANSSEMFSEAQRIYPAYELDIEPQREAAWGEAFNAGLAAYAEGDVDGTVDRWNDAMMMYDLSPEAHRNLAGLLATEGRYGEAVDVYRRAIEGLAKRPATRVLSLEEFDERGESGTDLEDQLTGFLMLTERYAEAEPLLRRRLRREPESIQVRSDLASALNELDRGTEAREIYATLLSQGGLEATELFNLGVGLFRVEDFSGAEEAFRRLSEVQPESRDAWFNRANVLFAMEDWIPLVGVGERLLELDPLGENALLIAARAHLETGDRDTAVEILQRTETVPVFLGGLRLRRAGAGTTVEGRVTGNVAEPGSPVELLFTFFGDRGFEVGTATATVAAPPEGESQDLSVTFAGRALSYRYEQIGSPPPQP